MYGQNIKTYTQAPISNRALRRKAREAINTGFKAYMTLLTVLAQKGGEVVVTKGTIEQVNATLPTLSYVVVPNKDNTEFTVRMVEGGKDKEQTDGGSIPVGTDVSGAAETEIEAKV